jgi:hypothetical protein
MMASMRILLALVGILMLGYAILDILWTTFLEGGAPLTTQAAARLARGMLRIQRRCTTRRVISLTGLVVVVATVLIWTVLLWAGWAFLFSASPDSLVDASTNQPAGVWERIYFTGYTLFTLGLGDFKPHGHFWQMATTIAAGSGFLLFGLQLAYLVPVISAATQKRQVAVYITSLGRSPDDIVLRAWNGQDTTALAPHLQSLTGMLALLGESHLTYPALHFFHGTHRIRAVAASVAALDEALTILECGLQQGCSLDLPSLGAAREAITSYLDTLSPALIHPAVDFPPPPSLDNLRGMGVPVVSDQLFSAALKIVKDRRRLLLAMVRNEGWDWSAVWPESGTPSKLSADAIAG